MKLPSFDILNRRLSISSSVFRTLVVFKHHSFNINLSKNKTISEIQLGFNLRQRKMELPSTEIFDCRLAKSIKICFYKTKVLPVSNAKLFLFVHNQIKMNKGKIR